MECGCGVGPDTENLLSLGARVVAVDIAGLDITKENLSQHKNKGNLMLVQADIADLPLKKKSFDIVFCHRVLQHTAFPPKTLDHILQYVKDEGAVFVHSYSDHPYQCWRWKYWLRPLTLRVPSEKLFFFIHFCAPALFKITRSLLSSKWGKEIVYRFIPFCNYRHLPQFKDKTDEFIIEYAIHNTFDALSPRYDAPIKEQKMREVAGRHLKKEFEVCRGKTITLLRTCLKRRIVELDPRKDYGFTTTGVASVKELPPWDVYRFGKIKTIFEKCATVLDFGKSSRELAALFSKVRHGKKLISVDIDPNIDPDIIADICDLNMIDAESIDGIICAAVLEHVYNPIKAAQELYRVLKKEGYLFLYVPWLFNYHCEKGYKDYYRFSPDAIRYMFRDFSSVDIIPIRGRFETVLNLFKHLGKRSLFIKYFGWILRKFDTFEYKYASGYFCFLKK